MAADEESTVYKASISNRLACETPSTRRIFSVEEVGFFEGPEKLLEVWFDLYSQEDVSCDPSTVILDMTAERKKDLGLRVFPRAQLEELLKLVHCEILSSCSNDVMDAYLLSESSLFVSNHRFILKTCGTTSLLHAIKPLLEMVQNMFPRMKVVAFFYSHRNFQKPHLQPYPHNSFGDEACYLDNMFDDCAACCLGKFNGGETWYLYTMCSPQLPVQDCDHTLEILMTKPDHNKISLYSTLAYSCANQLMRDTGIADIIPGAILDAKIFEPCGFSVNAIIKDDKYFTIHVTPQLECSWVSFETNLVLQLYTDIIKKVLNIFSPENCTISLFASTNAKCGKPIRAFTGEEISGYCCNGKQFCTYNTYDLTFAHYSHIRAPSLATDSSST